MTYDVLTADMWPGAPRVLPPLLMGLQRAEAYCNAVADSATLEQLEVVRCDVSQRVAAAMRKEGK